MEVVLEFPGSHHYISNYSKVKEFCPSCGKQELWVESGEGDHYLGSSYYCPACYTSHHLDSCGHSVLGPYKSVVDQLKSGKVIEPTTRKGR